MSGLSSTGLWFFNGATMMGSHALAAIIAAILSFMYCVYLESEVRKDYAKAGYIVIDTKAYRIIPADSQSRE
jgi:hypothetical protein